MRYLILQLSNQLEDQDLTLNVTRMMIIIFALENSAHSVWRHSMNLYLETVIRTKSGYVLFVKVFVSVLDV